MKIKVTMLSAVFAAPLIFSLLLSQALFAEYQPFREVQELVASDFSPGDHFGISFDLEGDLAVVGADRASHTGLSDAGAAYLFMREGLGFSQVAKLTALNAQANALFGVSLDLNEKTLVVGAPGEEDHGAAYVFVWNGKGMKLQARLVASDAAAGDLFGRTVAISGERILVGALGDSHSGMRAAGSAYVFVRSGDRWFEEQKLVPDRPRQQGAFGSSAILDGNTALISSFIESTGDGSVHAFQRQGRSWYQVQELSVPEASRGGGFGVRLALLGKSLIVTAPANDHSGMVNAGTAHLFERASVDGPFVQASSITGSNPWEEAWFGSGADMSDDLAVVSASSPRSKETGLAFVYTRGGAPWTEQQILLGRDVVAKDRFGEGVALDGDTLMVGGWSHDHGGVEDCGAVYVFMRKPAKVSMAEKALCLSPADDVAAPVVFCNTPALISPDDLPVTFAASAVDTCGATKVEVTNYACLTPNGSRPGIDQCLVEMRGERLAIQRLEREVTAVTWRARASDRAGNTITRRCRVAIEGR